MRLRHTSGMIHEEPQPVVDEVPPTVEEVDDVEGVYGDPAPVDEYRLSTRPRVVGGQS